MKRIKAVLFDLDGVLVDSMPVWFHAFNDALVHLGQEPLSASAFRETIWVEPSVPVALSKHYPHLDPESVYAFYKPRKHLYFDKARPMAHAHEVIERLGRHFGIGVVSNGRQSTQRDLMQSCGFMIPLLVTLDDVLRPKPFPDMIHHACSSLGVPAEEAAVVGDSEYDMAAARAAGSLAIGFRRAGDLSIQELPELIPILRGETHGTI